MYYLYNCIIFYEFYVIYSLTYLLTYLLTNRSFLYRTDQVLRRPSASSRRRRNCLWHTVWIRRSSLLRILLAEENCRGVWPFCIPIVARFCVSKFVWQFFNWDVCSLAQTNLFILSYLIVSQTCHLPASISFSFSIFQIHRQQRYGKSTATAAVRGNRHCQLWTTHTCVR